MGARSYVLIDKYCAEFKENEVVLEIGSSRGEGSTEYFAEFCRKRNVPFYSVDFEPSAYNRAKATQGTIAYQCTGEHFLENIFPKLDLNGLDLKIRFAYLDNFDWIWNGGESSQFYKNQINLYKKYNLVMNNENSQSAHLEQSILIDKYSADNCLILFDDTWQTMDGGFSGKGGKAVSTLLGMGYKIIASGAVGIQVMDSFVAVSKRIEND